MARFVLVFIIPEASSFSNVSAFSFVQGSGSRGDQGQSRVARTSQIPGNGRRHMRAGDEADHVPETGAGDNAVPPVGPRAESAGANDRRSGVARKVSKEARKLELFYYDKYVPAHEQRHMISAPLPLCLG